jgi:hypothetical protein
VQFSTRVRLGRWILLTFCDKQQQQPLQPVFLVSTVMIGTPHERVLMTGVHRIADVFCTCCSDRLGWIYVSTPMTHPNQRYKVGKVLLESSKIAQMTEELPLHPVLEPLAGCSDNA